jgi:hypothetical protein
MDFKHTQEQNHTIRLSSSHYTSDKASIFSSSILNCNDCSSTYWHNQSDRTVPAVQPYSRVKGSDIKHNSYQRRLNKLKANALKKNANTVQLHTCKCENDPILETNSTDMPSFSGYLFDISDNVYAMRPYENFYSFGTVKENNGYYVIQFDDTGKTEVFPLYSFAVIPYFVCLEKGSLEFNGYIDVKNKDTGCIVRYRN